ncbi:hypothetical protein [Streptomyces hirsutus]|uniref:hypothetical protein n=1 Tax=Streptomyces hirsutus TaxID=35620 RepID=UPI0033BA0073
MAIFSSASFMIAATVYAGNRRDKIRKQASEVTVHVEPDDDVGFVRNDSDLPIFDMTLLVKRGPEANPDYVSALWKIKITHTWVDCATRSLGPDLGAAVRLPEGLPDGSTIVAIGFSDAAGRGWLRETGGRLTGGYRPIRPDLNLGGQSGFRGKAPVYPATADGATWVIPSPRSGESSKPTPTSPPSPGAKYPNPGPRPRP